MSPGRGRYGILARSAFVAVEDRTWTHSLVMMGCRLELKVIHQRLMVAQQYPERSGGLVGRIDDVVDSLRSAARHSRSLRHFQAQSQPLW